MCKALSEIFLDCSAVVFCSDSQGLSALSIVQVLFKTALTVLKGAAEIIPLRVPAGVRPLGSLKAQLQAHLTDSQRMEPWAESGKVCEDT